MPTFGNSYLKDQTMLVKKLLARFINDKVLQNAEHCYIAAASISGDGFDLLMSRLSKKCHVDIVTGLDLPTDPGVLWKIQREYSDRVTLRIYTRNFFHPGVYIFDMPYRKRLAFIGSSYFTLSGFKDNEELSYQIDTEKAVEEIKSWFTGYFEDSQDLTEKIIHQYELVYPSIKDRDKLSREEKKQFIEKVMAIDEV
jgi:HKD family nuclease